MGNLPGIDNAKYNVLLLLIVVSLRERIPSLDCDFSISKCAAAIYHGIVFGF